MTTLHNFEWREKAQVALTQEAYSLLQLAQMLPPSLESVIHLMQGVQGKIICTGVGKSACVAQKVSGTLSSVGVPSFFLDATQAAHGDLGCIGTQDQILVFSYTGATQELLPIFQRTQDLNIPAILVTAFPASVLGRRATFVLSIPVVQEVGPLAAVPTTSTIVMLAMGDVLTLLLGQYLDAQDYRAYHPKGQLGYRFSQLTDVMHKDAALPLVLQEMPMSHVLLVMTEKRLGCAGVVDENGLLKGVISDGDLRRHLAAADFLDQPAHAIMTHNPRTIHPEALACEAAALMEKNKITFLFVVDPLKKALGLFHIHDYWSLYKAAFS
jgi:arabinose-5-phosphate isomerase